MSYPWRPPAKAAARTLPRVPAAGREEDHSVHIVPMLFIIRKFDKGTVREKSCILVKASRPGDNRQPVLYISGMFLEQSTRRPATRGRGCRQPIQHLADLIGT